MMQNLTQKWCNKEEFLKFRSGKNFKILLQQGF